MHGIERVSHLRCPPEAACAVYKGAETAPVIEAVMAPTQPGSKGTVHMGSEAACSLENGNWIPEFEQCILADVFAAQPTERF